MSYAHRAKALRRAHSGLSPGLYSPSRLSGMIFATSALSAFISSLIAITETYRAKLLSPSAA